MNQKDFSIIDAAIGRPFATWESFGINPACTRIPGFSPRKVAVIEATRLKAELIRLQACGLINTPQPGFHLTPHPEGPVLRMNA